MSSRYSDRFFNPDVVPSAEPEQIVRGDADGAASLSARVDGSVPADVLPRSTIAVDPDSPARRWYSEWSARAAIVLTLIVGVGGGAYGWEQWQAHQADLAARAAIDVSTSTQFEAVTAGQPWMAISIQNNGSYPVTFTGVVAADSRVRLGDEGGLPYLVEVGANDSIGVILQITVDCLADTRHTGGPITDVSFTAHMRTVDGIGHDVLLPLQGIGVLPDQDPDGTCVTRSAQQFSVS